MRGTGLPWQKQANVYIVGHRLGYPNTGSFLVFYDLNKMRKKDVVVLRDSKNKRYVYKVFRKMIVPPSDLAVTKPIKGKNIVSLQSLHAAHLHQAHRGPGQTRALQPDGAQADVPGPWR